MKATQAEILEAGLPASLAERLALRGLDAPFVAATSTSAWPAAPYVMP